MTTKNTVYGITNSLALAAALIIGAVGTTQEARAATTSTFRSSFNDNCVRGVSLATTPGITQSYCGASGQNFIFTQATNGAYSISPQGYAALCLQSNAAGAIALAACSAGAANQSWSALRNTDGTFLIKNQPSGSCLAVATSGNGVSAPACVAFDKSQKFKMARGLAPTPPPAFSSFGSGTLRLNVGQSVSLTDGTQLRFTTQGDLQVVSSTGTVLWTSNTARACGGNTACRTVFQSDGNLVIYGASGAIWSTGTYNNNVGALTLSSTAAHLVVTGSNYNVLWSSGGPANGLLTSALNPKQAYPVQTFLDSLGINSHMDQYETNVGVVADKLQYLGIRWIRDHYPNDDRLLPAYTTLAAKGIRFNMINYSNDFPTLIRHAETLAALGKGVLTSVEGPNEINNFSFSCNGSVWSGGWPNNNGPAADCFMTNYYAALKASTKLNGVVMYDLTGGASAVNAAQYGLLGITNHADFANIHPYPSPTAAPRGGILANLASGYSGLVPAQTVITEGGYKSDGLSSTAQAILTVDFFLDAFALGFTKTFIYQLSENSYETYGLFDRSGNPKAVATAIHNLTTILADSGSPMQSPGTLDYTISGMPSTGQSLLLRKSNGTYELILWNDTKVWSGTADVAVPVSSLQIALGRSFSRAALYNPFVDTASAQSWTNVSSVTVPLGAQAVVLELTP